MSKVSQETMLFKCPIEERNVSKTILEVYKALKEKGYNPIDQLSGYLLSGDPTYITSYKDARTKLRAFERQELMEELINNYLNEKKE